MGEAGRATCRTWGHGTELSRCGALRAEARWAGDPNGKLLPAKLEKVQRAQGQCEHRTALLWLEACFNAVELGLVAPEQGLPAFLVGRDGRTVRQAALPRDHAPAERELPQEKPAQ